MFASSFVQVPSIYCILSAGDILLGYLGKDIHVPLPPFAVLGIQQEYPLQDYRGFCKVQE